MVTLRVTFLKVMGNDAAAWKLLCIVILSHNGWESCPQGWEPGLITTILLLCFYEF